MTGSDLGLWNALLIGGASSVGKMTLARAIAAATDAEIVSLDQLREGPLEDELAEPVTWTRSPCEIAALLEAAGEVFTNTLHACISSARDEQRPTIIEGERILPRHVLDLGSGDGLRALFVVESDRAAIRENLSARPGRFAALHPSAQARVAEVDYLFGQRIERDAADRGQQVLRPRPWATGVARAAVVLRS